MAYLTRQQVKDILDKAPANLDKNKIVQELARTNTLEGFNDQQQEKKTVAGFAGNVLKSGADLVKNTVEAVAHPIQTVKGLGTVALGGAEKLIPGQQQHEGAFDGLINFYKERYGGLENIKHSLYTDPVGVAADVATVAGGVGLLGKVGTASKIGNFAKVTEAANTVSKFADPLQAITKIPGKFLPESFLSKTAQKVYQSALKPSTTLSPIERSKILLTGLREGIPVTQKGAMELGKRLDDINGQIAKVIEQGKKVGDVVETSKIVTLLDDVKKEFGLTPNGLSRIDDIDQIKTNFLTQYGDSIPTDVAQQIKKNTYKVLKKSYGEMKGVAVESEKALARGIKEQLAQKYKQLASLNEKDSALINLDKALERAVSRIDNTNLVGLGTTTASAVNPWAGMVKAIIDAPLVKSKLAIALQKAADRVPRNSRIRKILTPAQVLSKPQRETQQ